MEQASGKCATDTDSESLQSFSSSEMSERTVRLIFEAVYGEPLTPHGRPSSLHYQVPDDSELETFPEYRAENDILSDNEEMKRQHEELKKHCVLHCRHLTCRKTETIDKKQGIQRACTSTCTQPASPEVDAKAFTQLTSSTAKAAYEGASKEQELTLHLPTAIALITHMRKNKYLDIHHFLFASPHYERDTILQARYYRRAAETADVFILGGIEESLEAMLQFLPGKSRTLKVGELEVLLMTMAHWDCAEWMKKWVWGGRNRRGCVNLWKMEREAMRNAGAGGLVERAEESVMDVVGGLVWWDDRKKAEGKGKRQGVGETASS